MRIMNHAVIRIDFYVMILQKLNLCPHSYTYMFPHRFNLEIFCWYFDRHIFEFNHYYNSFDNSLYTTPKTMKSGWGTYVYSLNYSKYFEYLIFFF